MKRIDKRIAKWILKLPGLLMMALSASALMLMSATMLIAVFWSMSAVVGIIIAALALPVAFMFIFTVIDMAMGSSL